MPLLAVDEQAPAAHDNVDLIPRMRRLRIGILRGVYLDGQCAGAEHLGEALATGAQGGG